MAWLSSVTRELFGLFVDDVPFSVAILAWIGLGDLGLRALAIDLAWDAPLFALGFLAILLVSVHATARRHARRVGGDR